MATYLEVANKKLAQLQAEISLSRFQLDMIYWELKESEKKAQAQAIRQALVEFRAQLLRDKQTKQIIALQDSIHETLVALTEAAPLNEFTEAGEIKNPLTKRVFNRDKGQVLSNGCIYPKNTLEWQSREKKYFPRKLKGSPFELDDRDLQPIHSKRTDFSADMGTFAYTAGIGASVLTLLISSWSGASLGYMLYGALLATGIAAGVATGLAMAIFAAPGLIGLVIGASIGAWYYAKHHAMQLAPAPALVFTPTTGKVFEEMDVKKSDTAPTPQPDLVLDDSATEKMSLSDSRSDRETELTAEQGLAILAEEVEKEAEQEAVYDLKPV